jgi:hypothetical protein
VSEIVYSLSRYCIWWTLWLLQKYVLVWICVVWMNDVHPPCWFCHVTVRHLLFFEYYVFGQSDSQCCFSCTKVVGIFRQLMSCLFAALRKFFTKSLWDERFRLLTVQNRTWLKKNTHTHTNAYNLVYKKWCKSKALDSYVHIPQLQITISTGEHAE